jgi:hypothetical protein
MAQAEKAVNEFCSFCEKIVLRALIFGCFMYEVGKFILRLTR